MAVMRPQEFFLYALRRVSSAEVSPRWLTLCFLFGLLTSALSAQVNTGNLSGTIRDSSGAVVQRAHLHISEVRTGYERQVDSATDGSYTFVDLPIGSYTLQVSANGFSTLRQGVTISVGARVRSDLQLAVNGSAETVSVVATASSLSRDDASISTLIPLETIQNTPLYLRNWDDLLRNVPGVQINRYTNQGGATSSGRTGSFNVNGVHSMQNNFILDGIDNNTFSENVQELSTESAHPSVDVIAEFNVITNPYSAEYGRAPGAVVSVNTRSGTNHLHGTAYEYLRNDYFDAFDYFTKETTNPKKAKNHQNQFGGSLGGPILSNRAFYYFNYEGTRIAQGITRTSTVPLDNERSGNFSAAAAALAGVAPYATIYDPLTCATAYTIDSTCTQFSDGGVANKIPQKRIDTSVARLIALFPEPNFKNGQANYPETNNYFRTGNLTDQNDSYDARVDLALSSNDTVFVRFNDYTRTRSIPGYFGGLADGTSTSGWGNQDLKGASLVLGWTRILSSRMVNDFRFGWVRNFSYAQQQPFSLSAHAADYVPGIPEDAAVGGGVPLTTFSGKTFLGSPDFLPKRQIPMLYQYNDTLSWMLGHHALKLGTTVYAPMRNIFQDEPGTRGDLTFTGVFTGLSYADGLIGATEYDQLTNVFFVDQRLWMASGFAEDDWKVTPKLTLNLGMRYDFATPAYEAKNRMANFNPSGSGSLVFAKGGSLGDRSLTDPSTTNFGPRLGVSYALNDKTVLHGGYGVYYTVFERDGSEDQLALNPPYLINKTRASNKAPVDTPSTGFASNYLSASTIDLTNLTSYHIRAIDPTAHTPMIQQWSFGAQRTIARNWDAEVDYVGTKSSHLFVLSNYNQPTISNGVSTKVVPYSNFGQIEYMSARGHGNYNGLQASLTKNLTHGYSFKAAYTLSHSLDNTPEELESSSGDAPNGRNYDAWYGNSDFDVRQRISVNFTWELPFGKGKTLFTSGPTASVFGGWRLSGVYTAYSGHPVTASLSSESSLLDAYGFATAVPNVVGSVHYLHNPKCWFYTSKNSSCSASSSLSDAFADPGKYVVGNSHRNTLVGPRTQVLDASLVKTIPIHRDWSGEFRWEVFNAANHALFGQPSGDLSSGSVASITTLSGDPRVMQLALRLNW